MATAKPKNTTWIFIVALLAAGFILGKLTPSEKEKPPPHLNTEIIAKSPDSALSVGSNIISNENEKKTTIKKSKKIGVDRTFANDNNNASTVVEPVKYKKKKRYRSSARMYIRGPRGGCYYINSNGNKVYVDRSLCN